MRLSNEQVSQLIKEWTKDCERIAFAHMTASPLTRPRLIVSGTCKGHSVAAMKAWGLGLRRAMEGLNALTACSGFDLEENPTFWLQELTRLARPRLHLVQRLPSDLLSRFEVALDFGGPSVSSDVRTYGFATCISMDPASPAMAVRRAVCGQLREYLLTEPLMLDLLIGPARDMTNDQWNYFVRVLHDLERVWSLVSGSENYSEMAKVAIGREYESTLDIKEAGIDWPALASTFQRGMCRPVEVHGLLYQSKFNTRVFCDLMEAVSAADTVETMMWHVDNHIDSSAILFSAVAYMSSLKVLKLRELDRQDCAMYEWLAFALKRRRIHGLELSLMSPFHEHGAAKFASAMRREDETFACLILQDVLDISDFEYFQLGTTAEPVLGVEMTQEMLVDRKFRRSSKATGRRLDVLAQSGSQCVVVVPGCGLMWIHANALGSWQRPSENVCRFSMPRPTVKTLVFWYCGLDEVAPIIEVLDAEQIGLVLGNGLEKPSMRMWESLKQRCKLLRSLTMPGSVNSSLGALLTDPVTRGACTVETLVIGQRRPNAEASRPSPFFDAITELDHPVRQVLRELSMESYRISMDGLEALAASLVTNRQLRFLRLGNCATQDTWQTLQTKFDAIVGPTDRSRVWLYAFLLCVRRSPRWMLLPSECLRLVVEFAVVHARRQVVFTN